MKARNLWV